MWIYCLYVVSKLQFISISYNNFEEIVKLIYEYISGNNQRYSAGPQADWTRELRGLPMYHAPELARFAVIVPGRLRGPCQDFVSCLQKAARGMSWNIAQPRIFEIGDDR